MAESSRFGKSINNSVIGFNGLMLLGFLGIVWLMIFGNLSGNLGFEQTSIHFINDTGNLSVTGFTPATAQNRVRPSLSVVEVFNATDLAPIGITGNYTVTGVVIAGVDGGPFEGRIVSVNATVTFDGTARASTEGVINNVSAGASTYFGFSRTLFTILAIVLLITLLLALLFLVMSISKSFSGKGGGSSGEESTGMSAFNQ